MIVSPYDCELIGHWWHEGVLWIEQVYREIDQRRTIECRSLSEYIDHFRSGFYTIAMGSSSWGLNYDFSVWQNPEHGWIWPYINSSAHDMEQVLSRVQPEDERGYRILRQMGRELLLMQGSDWPFLLFTRQAKEYANQRFHHHHQRFRKLFCAAQDLQDPSRIEDIDRPWPVVDYTIFHHRQEPA